MQGHSAAGHRRGGNGGGTRGGRCVRPSARCLALPGSLAGGTAAHKLRRICPSQTLLSDAPHAAEVYPFLDGSWIQWRGSVGKGGGLRDGVRYCRCILHPPQARVRVEAGGVPSAWRLAASPPSSRSACRGVGDSTARTAARTARQLGPARPRCRAPLPRSRPALPCLGRAQSRHDLDWFRSVH